MSAACQACEAGVAVVVSRPLGRRGEPIGSCVVCRAFTCGSHGLRDPYTPEFICVECDPTRFVGSAAADASDAAYEDPASARLRAMAAVLDEGLGPLADAPWRFRTVEDLWRRRPQYEEVLSQLNPGFQRPTFLAATLIAAAAHLTVQLYGESLQSRAALADPFDPLGVVRLAQELDLR